MDKSEFCVSYILHCSSCALGGGKESKGSTPCMKHCRFKCNLLVGILEGNWASEVSPTLGCSIEISRDIALYMYVYDCLWEKHTKMFMLMCGQYYIVQTQFWEFATCNS